MLNTGSFTLNAIHSTRKLSKVEKLQDLKEYIKVLHAEEQLEIQDLRNIVDNIEVDVERDIALWRPKLGNPASVGLAGFAVTTMIMQFHNIGWLHNTAPIIWLGLFFGGLAQAISGLQEFGSGNNFGYSVFTTYGCFWMSFSSMMISDKMGLFSVTRIDVGYFLIAFTIYTAIVLVAASRISLVLTVIFALLVAGFVTLDVSHMCYCAEVVEMIRNATAIEQDNCAKYLHHLNVASGWLLLLASIGALYLMAQLLYKDAFKRDILPIGPPPGELLEKALRRKFHNGCKANVAKV